MTAILKAMHKRFIKIEDNRHLIDILLFPSQSEGLNCRLVGCLLVLGEELQEVDGVVEMVPGQRVGVQVLLEYFCNVVAASWPVRIFSEFLYLTFLFHMSHHLPDQLSVFRLVLRCYLILSLLFPLLLLLVLPRLLALLLLQLTELPPPQILSPGLEWRVVIRPSLSHKVYLPAIKIALKGTAFLLLIYLVLCEKSLVPCKVAFGQRDEAVELRTAQQFLNLSSHLGVVLLPSNDVVLTQFDDLAREGAMEWTGSSCGFGLAWRHIFHLLTKYYRRAQSSIYWTQISKFGYHLARKSPSATTLRMSCLQMGQILRLPAHSLQMMRWLQGTSSVSLRLQQQIRHTSSTNFRLFLLRQYSQAVPAPAANAAIGIQNSNLRQLSINHFTLRPIYSRRSIPIQQPIQQSSPVLLQNRETYEQ